MDVLIAAEEAARVQIVGGRDMVLATMRAEFVEELADLLEEDDATWSSRPRNSSNVLDGGDDRSSVDSDSIKLPKKLHSQDLLRDTQYELPPQTGDDIDVSFCQMQSEEKYFIGILAIHVFISTKKRSPEILGTVLESLQLPDNIMTSLVQLCNDAEEQELGFEQIATAAKMLRPEARLGTIVAIAASVLKDGTYDARLRWGLKRLAQILKVPWERVAAAEMLLASALLNKAMNSPKHATKGKGSSYRWLKVGAGVTVGAGVLLVTGGLAAPLVAAAATSLASTTAGIAAAAGLTAVSTAIVSTATSLGVVMTVPVITALFGAAGAGLTGFKVYKRTAGVDSFVCRSIRDISIPSYLLSDPCTTLATERGVGPTVPLSARQVTCQNILRKQNNGRQIAIAIENFDTDTDIGELLLVATSLDHGEWVYTPPRLIKSGSAAICCCQTTRFGMRVNGCVVYRTASGEHEFCFAFECPMVGPFKHRCLRGGRGAFTDLSASTQSTLSQRLEWSQFLINKKTVTLSASGKEEAVYTIDPRDVTQQEATFLSCQLEAQVQQLEELMSSFRSKCVITIQNKSSSSLRFVKHYSNYGIPMKDKSLPAIIECGFHGIFGFHNKWMRPTGVSGALVYSFTDTQTTVEGPVVQTFYLLVSLSYSLSGVLKTYAEVVDVTKDKKILTESFLSQLVSKASSKGISKEQMKYNSEGELESVDGWRVEDHHASYCFSGATTQQDTRPGLHVIIGISGMTVHDDPRVECNSLQEVLWKHILDYNSPILSELAPGSDPHFITWESQLQATFGDFMTEPTDYGTMMRSAANRGATEALKNPLVAGATGLAGATYFAAAAMWASLAWPYYAIQAADLIDSTYGILVKKAKEAGELLAQMLLSKAQGSRPVTLVGVSLGANVIFHALVALSKAANENGFGIVESAILIGATIPCDSSRWKACREVVAGRLVNVYSGHDWFLAFLHRGCTASLLSVAGLTKVHHQGIENVNVNHLVKVSADYIRRLPEVLQCVGSWPTAQTYCKSNSIPGKIRLLADADEELDVVAESSLSGSTIAVCIRNKSSQTFQFVSSTFDGGDWEVTPTSEPIFSGHAEICMASSQSKISSAVFGLSHYTSEQFELLIVFRIPTYGEMLITADILPKGSDLPILEDFANSKKMGISAGKSFYDTMMIRYERLDNKLVVTIRQRDGSEPAIEEISSPINSLCVGAGVVVPVSQTNIAFLKLLSNKKSLIAHTRQAGIAIRNKTPFEIVYCWSYMTSGTWTATPTPEVKSQEAGICLCSSSLGKSVTGVLCYAIEDKVAVLFAFSVPLVGTPSVYSRHVPISEAGDEAACDALKNLKSSGSKYTWQQYSDLILKLSWKCPPGDDVKLYFTIHKTDQMIRRQSVLLSERNTSPVPVQS